MKTPGEILQDLKGASDYDEVTKQALAELKAQEAIVKALAPLSPRMRMAVLHFVWEKLEDDREKAKKTIPPLVEEP